MRIHQVWHSTPVESRGRDETERERSKQIYERCSTELFWGFRPCRLALSLVDLRAFYERQNHQPGKAKWDLAALFMSSFSLTLWRANGSGNGLAALRESRRVLRWRCGSEQRVVSHSAATSSRAGVRSCSSAARRPVSPRPGRAAGRELSRSRDLTYRWGIACQCVYDAILHCDVICWDPAHWPEKLRLLYCKQTHLYYV